MERSGYSVRLLTALFVALALGACSKSSNKPASPTPSPARANFPGTPPPPPPIPTRISTAAPLIGGGQASPAARAGTAATGTAAVSGFSLTSTAFQANGNIPAQYSCDGQGISPPLAWSGAPTGTAAFALVVDDPDAGSAGFVHWLIWNLPGTANSLPENVPTVDQPPTGGVQGHNGANRPGYQPPCPPAGPAHHYRFTLYALRAPLSLAAGANAAQLQAVLPAQTIAQAQLVGLYQRAAR